MKMLKHFAQTSLALLMLCAFFGSGTIQADLYVQQIATVKKISPSKKFIYYFTFVNTGTEDITFTMDDFTPPDNINLLSVGYTTSPDPCIAHTQNAFTPGFDGHVNATITICPGYGFNVALNCKAASSFTRGTDTITNTVSVTLPAGVNFAPNSVFSVKLPVSK